MAGKSKKPRSIFDTLRKEFGNPKYGRREFKRDLRKLQKSNLISSKVDIASQDVTRYMQSAIRKFAGVLSGTEHTIVVPPREKHFYRESGFKTKGRTVIVPTPNKEKVKRIHPTEEGFPQFKREQQNKNGTRRTGRNIVVPYTSLEAYILDLAENAGPLDNHEHYAFRFHGHMSYGTFKDPEAMALYIAKYKSVEEAFMRGDIEAQEGVYQNIEVFKITIPEHTLERAAETAHVKSERRLRNAQRRADWEREHGNKTTRVPKERTPEAERKAKSRTSNPERYAAEIKAKREKRRATKNYK